MKKKISSETTFIAKFIIPVIILLTIIFMSFYIYIKTKKFTFITFILIFSFIYLYFYFFKLKKVEIDEQNLYISNYLKTIKVERKKIKKITVFKFLNPKIIIITFNCKTEFGKRITFSPSSFKTLSIRDELENNLITTK